MAGSVSSSHMMHTSSVVDLMHTGLAAYLDTLFPGEGLRVLQAQPPLGGRSCNLRPAKLPQRSPAQAHSPESFAPEHSADVRSAAVQPVEARTSPKLRPVIGDESLEDIDCLPSAVMLDIDARTSKKRSQASDDDEEVLSESGSAVSTACGSDEAAFPSARLTTTRSADSLNEY